MRERFLNGGGAALPSLGSLFSITVLGALLCCFAIHPAQRRVIFAVLLIILLICAVVVLGRATETATSLWQVKYTSPAFLWLCILIALVYNSLWHWIPYRYERLFLLPTAAGLLLYLVMQSAVDCASSARPTSLCSYTGRSHYVQSALARKAAVKELRHMLASLVPDSAETRLRIPTLDGFFINEVHPCLGLFNLSHYSDFVFPVRPQIILLRNEAMQSWRADNVVTVPSLRDAVDPSFIQSFTNRPEVQRYYLAPASLVAARIPPLHRSALQAPKAYSLSGVRAVEEMPQALSFQSDGYAKLLVRGGWWDPEEHHILSIILDAYPARSEGPLYLGISFSGSLAIPYSMHTVRLPATNPSGMTVDLLQLYTYSLNQRVANLYLEFPFHGWYKVYSVRLE
jgi:hypothetical protein